MSFWFRSSLKRPEQHRVLSLLLFPLALAGKIQVLKITYILNIDPPVILHIS